VTPPAAQALPQERDVSFERLYETHRPAVYGLLLRDLRDPEEAEDVTQVTFLNAYRALRRGDEPESPRAWLLTIARNACRRRFRALAARAQEVELDPELVGPSLDYDGPSAAEIRAALRRLKPSHRAVIFLREFWGFSYEEIAEKLGVSHSAVETLLFRARRRLREELEAGEPRPERRLRGILALPLPVGLVNAFDSLVFTLGRTGLVARAAGAGLLAAAAVGTGVAVEVGGAEPAAPRTAIAVEAAVPVASLDELSLHQSAAAEAAAVAGERVRADARGRRESSDPLPQAPVETSAPAPVEAPSLSTSDVSAESLTEPLPEADPSSLLPAVEEETLTLPEAELPLPTLDEDALSSEVDELSSEVDDLTSGVTVPLP
jgi:RNA polymerase sigma-70 factor (ECF subfamily)